MMIQDITVKAGKFKASKRIGRGEGGGRGKTSGRGQKGASSRSGHARKAAFEGGQMPYFRRMPKFGFTNAAFRTNFWIVNISEVLSHPAFAKGGEVSIKTLVKAGLVRDTSRPLKILGNIGEDGLKVKLTVVAERVSAKARELVIKAGGSVTETGTRRDKVRGIDRNSEDRSPKNLTKKLNRGGKKKPVVAEEAEGETKADDKKK